MAGPGAVLAPLLVYEVINELCRQSIALLVDILLVWLLFFNLLFQNWNHRVDMAPVAFHLQTFLSI